MYCRCVTIRSRANSILSTICNFYIRESSFSKKITDPQKNSTYAQYLTVLTSTSQPSGNDESPASNKTPQPASTNYERLIAHAEEVKFINNRYTTPITVEFGSSESENSVNLPVKHRKISIAIKLLDSSTSTTIKNKVITNPLEFPMGTEYTESFDVITDKKNKFPRFFVHRDLHSTLNVSAMKYGDHNIMSTLQSLRTWVNFNIFSTHRVASIGFFKYVSTGLTLHSTAKKRVINTLMNDDLNDTDITALQECTTVTKMTTSNNKRNTDGNSKDPDTPNNIIVFLAFDIYLQNALASEMAMPESLQ